MNKWRRGPLGRTSAVAAALLLLVTGATGSRPAGASNQEDDLGARARARDAQLLEIRAEMDALKADYERRISELESRLAEIASLSEPRIGDPPPDSDSDATATDPDSTSAVAEDLAVLREAARSAAAALPDTPSGPTPLAAGPAVGRERNLSLLNPEISFTGIVLGLSDVDDRETFEVGEFELDLQSVLDPFSRTRVTLAVGDEGVELEEIYVGYSSLPGGLELLAGKFRQRFGPLNRQHLHALPQSEYPLVYQTYFGDEGLAQTGVSLSWLLPRPWASANEVTLEITDGENEEAFAGEFLGDSFSVLGRVKNFWDFSDATYFEWGLSAIAGKTALDGDSRVYGTDFTLGWQPAGRAKYRGVTWRTEVLQSSREDRFGRKHEAWGGYSYVEGLLRRNLYAGVRIDSAQEPFDPDRTTTGIVPYLTWWQSEYVRLRAEYGLFESDPGGSSEDRFSLQLTWAAGPHKHESY